MQLSSQQKELLLDYALGIAPPSDSHKAQQLIESNPEARQLYRRITSALAPLECVQGQQCPEELAERTITSLIQAAERQLAARPRVVHPRTILFNRNLAQLAAVAAIVVFGVGIALPALSFTRNLCMRYRCQWQLAKVYQGLTHYMSDSDGRMPSVTIPIGQPWWKVGYQGSENHSNTRSAWLLVKHGYAPAKAFICPAAGNTALADGIDASSYNDFPGRQHINYSFRLCCQGPMESFGDWGALAADMNPLGERLPSDYSRPLRLRIDQSLLTANSRNHNRRGQNVLTSSGAVRFARTRALGPSGDDIFSLSNMQCGMELTGCEQPTNAADTFLVP